MPIFQCWVSTELQDTNLKKVQERKFYEQFTLILELLFLAA